jgi:predicted transcriptional regulator
VANEKAMTLRLSTDLDEQVASAAEYEDMTKSEFIRMALEDYLIRNSLKGRDY